MKKKTIEVIKPTNDTPIGFMSFYLVSAYDASDMNAKKNDKYVHDSHSIYISSGLQHLNYSTIKHIKVVPIVRYTTAFENSNKEHGSGIHRHVETIVTRTLDTSKPLGSIEVLHYQTTDDRYNIGYFIHACDLERYKAEIARINAIPDLGAITRRILGK